MRAIAPRIVILSAFLSPFRSGAEACAEEVALALHSECDVTIVTARLRPDLPREELLQGKVPVVRVGWGRPMDKWLFPFLAPFAAHRLRPSLIHAVLESYAGLALMLCRFIAPRSRRVLTCQSTNTQFLMAAMHRSAHRVTVISSVLLERAKRLGRSDAVLIPNGLRYAALREACARTAKVDRRILFVGRLEPMKGINTLLTAFAVLLDHGVEAELQIVGDGSLRKELQELSESLGIASRVTFLGYLPPERVCDAFAAAPIFCGLSRSEALGNVFLEAQAAGCAVVATNVGGIPDIVHHEQTGLLVPVDDAVAAAERITQLFEDTSLRARLSEAGIAAAAAYDWSFIASRYAQVYEDVLSLGSPVHA